MLCLSTKTLDKIVFSLCAGALVVIGLMMAPAGAMIDDWEREWPHTDFSRHAVDLDEIVSGGPSKDGIPSIDHPRFSPFRPYLNWARPNRSLACQSTVMRGPILCGS